MSEGSEIIRRIEEVSRETWEAQGRKLAGMGRKHQWEVAGWILVGDTRWGGEAYDTAEQLTGYSRKTLIEWAYVARNCSIRMDQLSFGHHQVVAALEPIQQEQWLKKAAEWPGSPLSVSGLRKAIADERKRNESPFSISLPRELYEKLKLLARASSMSEETLAIRAVSTLMESSAGQIKAQAEAELADYRAKQLEEGKARFRTSALNKAQSAAEEKWKQNQEAARNKYVNEKTAELLKERDQAQKARDTAQQKLTEAARNGVDVDAAKKVLDEAESAFDALNLKYTESVWEAQQEAKEQYPIKAVDDLKVRAEQARLAALEAERYLRQANFAAQEKAAAAAELKARADRLTSELAEVQQKVEAAASGK